jgi:hypothetical protein
LEPSGFEPAVKDFFDPFEMGFARFGGDGDVVDAVSMKVFDPLDAGKFFEFGNRTNADNLMSMYRLTWSRYLAEIIVNPKGKWSSPVTISRDVPVLTIANPICKSSFLDECRDPKINHGLCFRRTILSRTAHRAFCRRDQRP